jgi:deoxyribonuclease V
MIYCLDVLYSGDTARVACVGFHSWSDDQPSYQKVTTIPGPLEPYVPGQFYKRELPCLLAALEGLTDIELVVVDSHVWVGDKMPGLGAKLHAKINVPVIGVAKTKYLDAPVVEVLRGEATNPLYVDAVGVDNAPDLVKLMAGPFRIPTLLKLADSLSRT